MMARRSRRRRQRARVAAARRFNIAGFLRNERNRKIVRLGCWGLVVATALTGVMFAATRTEAYVLRELARSGEQPSLSFPNLPEQLDRLARDDLTESAADLLTRDWNADSLCRDLATRLAEVGWIAEVHTVRRADGTRFEVDARYRIPFAMVRRPNGFSFVDGDGVRLPGTYRFDPTWMIIQGVQEPAPESGKLWPGDDIRAAVEVIRVLAGEPFASQVTAVLVENFGSKGHSKRIPIELATDRAGGRIRWGSAPGAELVENSVNQKLAILRENFRRTGRVDAGHPVIDISIFPDRFTIPG